jgi:hypothetical protein
VGAAAVSLLLLVLGNTAASSLTAATTGPALRSVIVFTRFTNNGAGSDDLEALYLCPDLQRAKRVVLKTRWMIGIVRVFGCGGCGIAASWKSCRRTMAPCGR